jgi:CBS domain containing-hemolysin-like protein
MNHRYFLPPHRDLGAAATLRYPPYVPTLKINDPAARAMTDFQLDAAPMASEEMPLEQAVDEMFRLGTRAFLVLREGVVTGLVSVEQAQPARGLTQRAADGAISVPAGLRVADVMTPAAQVPAVDWQVVEEAQIRDLVDIFEGSGAQHLLVLENENAQLCAVRGLIHRERLERQLGTRWAHTALASARRPVLR